MKVLILGSGGREHALAWALSRSALLTKLYCAPGNAGIAEVATCLPIDLADNPAVVALCKSQGIDFVVVGPEGPLVAGLIDDLTTAGIRAFGPSRDAAQLEGSKGFTKDLCAEFGIPTAAYGRFKDAARAQAFLKLQSVPIVIKADGLAAGNDNGKRAEISEQIRQEIEQQRIAAHLRTRRETDQHIADLGNTGIG